MRDVLQFPADLYSGHSPRAGFVTQARRDGVADHLIARHCRLHSVKVPEVYDHPADALDQPALSALKGW